MTTFNVLITYIQLDIYFPVPGKLRYMYPSLTPLSRFSEKVKKSMYEIKNSATTCHTCRAIKSPCGVAIVDSLFYFGIKLKTVRICKYNWLKPNEKYIHTNK